MTNPTLIEKIEALRYRGYAADDHQYDEIRSGNQMLNKVLNVIRADPSIPTEPSIKELHAKAGVLNVKLEQDAALEFWAATFLRILDDVEAINYMEAKLSTEDGRKVVVTVRRQEGKTPHDLRDEALEELNCILSKAKEATESFHSDHYKVKVLEEIAELGDH